MSTTRVLAYISVDIIPKGCKFNQDDYQFLSRYPEEDEEVVPEVKKYDVANNGQLYPIGDTKEYSHLAKEEIFGFHVHSFGGIGVNDETYDCLQGDVENISAQDIYEPFIDDFIKITREHVQRYKDTLESYNKKMFFDKDLGYRPSYKDDKINYVTFLGVFEGYFSYDSYTGEGNSEWEFKGEHKF